MSLIRGMTLAEVIRVLHHRVVHAPRALTLEEVLTDSDAIALTDCPLHDASEETLKHDADPKPSRKPPLADVTLAINRCRGSVHVGCILRPLRNTFRVPVF